MHSYEPSARWALTLLPLQREAWRSWSVLAIAGFIFVAVVAYVVASRVLWVIFRVAI